MTQINQTLKILVNEILNAKKDAIVELKKKHNVHVDKAKKIYENTNPEENDVQTVLTGEGIASINGSSNGIRMTYEAYAKSFGDKYNNEISPKLIAIATSLEENKDEKDPVENFRTLYENLCKSLPTNTPNNITNRFLATLFYDKLTTIASWDELKKVLVYIKEEKVLKNKKSKPLYWLPLNRYLNKEISKCLEEDQKELAPILGWELVVLIKEKQNKDLIELLKNNKNLILTGAPGTGKTYKAHQLARILCEDVEERIGFVQFHPSYDYTDFVEGLRPTNGNTKVDFSLEDGIFKTFCKQALDEGSNHVFIIDEINRGEISKIFGELFFSIDPGYRGKEGKVRTQYANMQKDQNAFDKVLGENKYGHFFVPENVYIIGTMNDIDRSVESMDFAFRRRFAFYEVKATNDMLNSLPIDSEAIDKLKLMMKDLNEAIVNEGLTEAYQIGGSYFLKIKNYFTDEKYTIENFKKAAEALWEYHLKGTLYEYFRGEPHAEKKLENLKKEYEKVLLSKTNDKQSSFS